MRTVDVDDAGYTMIALLVVVLILGVLSAVVLGGGFANPQPVVTATKGHVVSACEADYNIVDEAVQSYFDANLVDPPAGPSWATAHAHGGPYLQSWPDDPGYYDIAWTGRNLGVDPAHGLASFASSGSSAAATGCFAR
jgi:type II secretory pathway pseudopilin PulG